MGEDAIQQYQVIKAMKLITHLFRLILTTNQDQLIKLIPETPEEQNCMMEL